MADSKKLNSGSFGNEPGFRKPLGRPPGTLNKTTALIKNTFMKVFNDLQSDPENNLLDWANREPTEFYKLASKFIPTEVDVLVKEVITVRLFDDEDDFQEIDPEDAEFEDIDPDDLL